MGAFLSAIGGALVDKAKNKFLNGTAGQAYDRYRQAKQEDEELPQNQVATVGPAGPPSAMQIANGDMSAFNPEPMSQGRIVTKPTVALLGERGAEAVVPLNGNPANKVSMHPRYRR